MGESIPETRGPPIRKGKPQKVESATNDAKGAEMKGKRVPTRGATSRPPRAVKPPKPVRERRPATQEKFRALLRVLAESHKRLTVGQIADRTRITRGTVSTYLGFLLYEQMVDHERGKRQTHDARYRLYGITDEGHKYLTGTEKNRGS